MAIDVEALKARTDIVAVVGSRVALKKRGAELVGLCPFHADKNPSFWVSPAKQFCHCFACGAHHDVISFLQEIDGSDFVSACEQLGATDTWQPAAPITHEATKPRPERITSKPPPDAPAPKFTIRGLGEPVRTWAYRDTDGGILGYVARYETPEGKQIRVWSWGSRADQAQLAGWACGHWNNPRPLYGRDTLARRDTAQVLVVEGEKAAEAAQALLEGYAVVTWPGGSQSWHRAGWEPLRGRKVLLWPDNDASGRECMEKLAALLADPRGLACEVSLIDPDGQPAGWDIADWTGTAAELIAWAKPRKRPYIAPQQNPAPPVAAAPVGGESAPTDAEPVGAGPARKPQAARKPRLAVVDGNAALAPVEDAEALPAAMSEDCLADHFAGVHGSSWRFVNGWGAWFEWRGDGWHRDDTMKVDRLAVEVTRQSLYWQDAAQLTPKDRRMISSRRVAGAVRDLAKSDRRIAATVDQWDVDPWLLGVLGGVVDLRTGKLHDARAEDYITKRTAVAPEAGLCQMWTALLERITRGDDSMLQYLRRWCGYMLTGETREECFAFVYGPAQTGKSTFVRVLQEILGSYHVKASMETFTETRHERHAEELAVLAGARLVTSVETEEGRRWNESRIKALTGRDRMRARFMRENSFEFEPKFKLLIAGNHAPHLRNVDEAMRRRLHIIPFTDPVTMEERDDQLAEKLRAEYPQILAWMVQGSMDWQAYKLGRPDQIAQAVDNYLESEDTFGEWMAECTEIDRKGRCQSGAAYKSYKQWTEAAGEFCVSQKRFTQALRERGMDTQKGSGGTRLIAGLTLKAATTTSDSQRGRYPD